MPYVVSPINGNKINVGKNSPLLFMWKRAEPDVPNVSGAPNTSNASTIQNDVAKHTASIQSPFSSSSPRPSATLADMNKPASTSDPVLGYGGYTYGTDPAKDRARDADRQHLATDPAYKQSEIERTKAVIAQRKALGLDTADQYDYLYNTLGVQKGGYHDTNVSPPPVQQPAAPVAPTVPAIQPTTVVPSTPTVQPTTVITPPPTTTQPNTPPATQQPTQTQQTTPPATNTGTQQTDNTQVPGTTPTTQKDYSYISDEVMNQLEKQKQAIEQQLAQAQQANSLAVNQNDTFLQDQIKKLEQNRERANQEIRDFQNRRGGLYSGGVDYQTAQSNKGFASAEGTATTNTAQRNADIWNRNALLAQQAAANISQLVQQAPDVIRSRVQQQMQTDMQNAMAEAGLTGVYNGQSTLGAQQQAFDQNLQSAEFGLNQQGQAYNQMSDQQKFAYQQARDAIADQQYQKKFDQDVQQYGVQNAIAIAQLTGNLNGNPTLAAQQQQFNQDQDMAVLTGYLPDGTPTNATQQQQLANAWNTIDTLGYVPENLASIVGVPAGTQTAAAKQQAFNNQLAQQDTTQQTQTNANQAQVVQVLQSLPDAQTAMAYLNDPQNSSEIIKEMGIDAYNYFVNLIPTLFNSNQADNSQLLQQAIKLAQSDVEWQAAQTADARQAIVDKYMSMLQG